MLILCVSCQEDPLQIDNDPQILGKYTLASSPELNKFNLSAPDHITITKSEDFYVLHYEFAIVEYFDGRFAPIKGENLMKGIAVDEFFGVHFPTLSGTVGKFYNYKKLRDPCAYYLEFNVHHWEGEEYTHLIIGGCCKKAD